MIILITIVIVIKNFNNNNNSNSKQFSLEYSPPLLDKKKGFKIK